MSDINTVVHFHKDFLEQKRDKALSCFVTMTSAQFEFVLAFVAAIKNILLNNYILGCRIIKIKIRRDF